MLEPDALGLERAYDVLHIVNRPGQGRCFVRAGITRPVHVNHCVAALARRLVAWPRPRCGPVSSSTWPPSPMASTQRGAGLMSNIDLLGAARQPRRAPVRLTTGSSDHGRDRHPCRRSGSISAGRFGDSDAGRALGVSLDRESMPGSVLPLRRAGMFARHDRTLGARSNARSASTADPFHCGIARACRSSRSDARPERSRDRVPHRAGGLSKIVR